MTAARRTIELAPGLILPADEAQTQTAVVYGGKGMGKSHLGRLFVEKLAALGLRFSWIDPVGVAWGLKYSRDGRHKGIEVLILGGIHGDLPLLSTAGEVVADLVVDEHVNVIIDISRHPNGRMWSRGEKVRFMKDYMTRLYARQGERRRPILQVIDECGRFAPEQIPKGADPVTYPIVECRAAIEEVVELGRNVGIGVWLITQRSARMAKSVSELAEMMIAFRTVGPRSLGSIVDWFGEHIPRARQNELIERIRQLPRGTGTVVSPGWLGIEGEFAFELASTFDSSETPTAGKERRPRGKGATLDVGKYRDRMNEMVEEFEADDPAALKRQLAVARREVEELKKRPPEKVATAKPEPAEPVEVEKPVKVEVPMFDRKKIAAIESAAASIAKSAESVAKAAGMIVEELRDSIAKHEEAAARIEEMVARRAATAIVAEPPRRSRPPTELPPKLERPSTPPVSTEAGGEEEERDESKLDKGVLNMLHTVARHYPMVLTYSQLATLAGHSLKSSSVRVYLGELKRRGLVDVEGKAKSSLIQANDTTFEYLGISKPLPKTPEELRDAWFHALGDGEGRFLKILLDKPDDWVHRDDLAAAAGHSLASSSIRVYLGTLRRNGLVENDGAHWRVAPFLVG